MVHRSSYSTALTTLYLMGFFAHCSTFRNYAPYAVTAAYSHYCVCLHTDPTIDISLLQRLTILVTLHTFSCTHTTTIATGTWTT
jgi:hypothetical protein